MKQTAALALGMLLLGCAPPPSQVAMPPVALDPATLSECALIQREIAAQQRHAALGSIDATQRLQRHRRTAHPRGCHRLHLNRRRHPAGGCRPHVY
jgi:hypothetical protein